MATDPIASVRKLLYRRLRVRPGPNSVRQRPCGAASDLALPMHVQVVLRDSRVLWGDFQSFDKQGNLILGQTHESVATSTGKVEERHMGMVLIPHEQQAKVELQASVCGFASTTGGRHPLLWPCGSNQQP